VRSLALVALVALVALTWAAAGCGRSHALSRECERDDQCGAGHVCATGTCLALAAPPPEWAVEVEPLSDSEQAGLLELQSLPSPLKLDTVGRLPLAATVSPEMGAPPLTSAHVVLSVPAAIPGRPDLRFETELVAPSGAGGAASFRLSLPAGTMGRAATLRLIPTGDDDAGHAPVTLAVTVAPTLALTLPSKSFTVQGRLFLAVGDAKVGQVARAFQGSELVSTVDATTDDGTFVLSIPASRAGSAAPLAVVVELAPPTGALEPRLISKPFSVTANVDLGDLHLPAFITQSNVFRFSIRAAGETKLPVAGTVVYARTRLSDDASGVATFQRQGTTSDTGQVDLALLPGSTTALRSYDVAIVPPTDSPYATRCLTKFPLGAGGITKAPAIVSTPDLPRRTLVGRTVHASDGVTPAEGVMVVVTRTAADPTLPCAADVLTRTPTATTDARGTISLYLDPGTYRFDYVPPAGSPWPRISEEVVLKATTTTTSTSDTKTLPDAVAADGTARDATGQPLSGAAVRLFEVPKCVMADCAGEVRQPPTLRAEARTDAAGHFRAVFAAP
jgi:hypothetical protein